MLVPFLLAFDFMNFTYATNPCAHNVPVPVVMRKGSFSYFDAKMGAGFDLSVVSVLEGSLNAGTRQAVVVLRCDFPVGGTAKAYLFDERGNSAVLLGAIGDADWGIDWGAGPASIRARFANGLLYVQSCQDTDCKTDAVATYAVRAGKLRKVAARPA